MHKKYLKNKNTIKKYNIMKGKAQQQKQVTISAYSMEVIQESFTSTLK